MARSSRCHTTHHPPTYPPTHTHSKHPHSHHDQLFHVDDHGHTLSRASDQYLTRASGPYTNSNVGASTYTRGLCSRVSQRLCILN